MIGYLRGTIEEIEEDAVLLDRDGIGFRVRVPASCLNGVLRKGHEVRLYTHLHVKEDALTLYGFLSRDDLEIFRMLTGVSGIGPKGALGILSSFSADDLRFAVLAEDAALIAKAPGIGKKTAQKVILELKDKLRLEEAFEKKLEHEMASDPAAAASAGTAESDVAEALVALGYSGAEALRAVRSVEGRETMDQGTLLKQALRRFRNG